MILFFLPHAMKFENSLHCYIMREYRKRSINAHNIRTRYVNSIKLEHRRRIKYVFEVLRDTLIADAFIWVMPKGLDVELRLMNETITKYGIVGDQRAVIKRLIYDSWYSRFSYNIFYDFDSKIEAFRKGPRVVAAAMEDIKSDEDRAELKKQITDFVEARNAAWIDSLAPGSILAEIRAPLSN